MRQQEARRITTTSDIESHNTLTKFTTYIGYLVAIFCTGGSTICNILLTGTARAEERKAIWPEIAPIPLIQYYVVFCLKKHWRLSVSPIDEDASHQK